MEKEQAIDQVARSCRLFVEKRRLLLTVDVTSAEAAEQLLSWLYSPQKPMKAELLEVAWDKVAVPIEVAEALRTLREALERSPRLS